MQILDGMSVVECGAFIAGPFASMTLAELGADVIRIDHLAGGLDFPRWPITADGTSLYWAGLNKGKRSVAIDLTRQEGRELAQEIICAPGEDRGIFLTNLPAKGWLDYSALRDRRDDLIMVNVLGNRDGTTALDYTVNCAVGFPTATGVDGDAPVNHVLPAWDFICGQAAATAVLAAERHRERGGGGQLVRLALSDVALAVVADMGLIAQVELNGEDRPRYGNHIYGAYGRDFVLADGRRVMVAAVSIGQWKALCAATGIGPAIAEAERASGRDFSTDSDRFEGRAQIDALLQPWFAARTLADVKTQLDGARACWGLYQTFAQLVAEDPRCSTRNTMFERVEHPGIGSMLTSRGPLQFGAFDATAVQVAPTLGQHTDEVLASVLGLGSGAIGKLHDDKVIGAAS